VEGEESARQKRDTTQPGEDRTESGAGEDPAVTEFLRLFLDVDETLKANNRRLLETLLEGRSDGADASGRDEVGPSAAGDSAGTAAPSAPGSKVAVWRDWSDIERPVGAWPRRAAVPNGPQGVPRPDGGGPPWRVEAVSSAVFLASVTMSEAMPRLKLPTAFSVGDSSASRNTRIRRAAYRQRPARLLAGWRHPR
jgi:hypothetical protein